MEGAIATASYIGQSSLHPLALAAILLLSLLALVLPARLALTSLLVAATTLPIAQRIVLGGADLTLLRLLLLAYVIRILCRKEFRDFNWGRVDTMVLLWTVAGTAMMTIHFGTMSAFINRGGWAYEVLLTYLITRCLIRNVDDMISLCKIVAIISIPVAATFLMEYFTQRNPYAIFGGVRPITWIREGRLRCQGAFTHPLMAGTFWAATLPLTWWLWRHGRARLLALTGFGSALIVIFCVSSSTPILSTMVAFVGIALFGLREHRTKMWVGLFAMLFLLHLVMEAPVWHLLSRVDLVGGSTGWHRYKIFDAFIENFGKWFLTGESNPMGWGVWEMRDITNQYILEGLRGGLLALFFFIMVLAYSFGNVGKGLSLIRHLKDVRADELLWLIGVTLYLHAVTFFGISYHGQVTALMYIHLALAGALLPSIVPGLLNNASQADAAAAEPGPSGKKLRLGAGRPKSGKPLVLGRPTGRGLALRQPG